MEEGFTYSESMWRRSTVRLIQAVRTGAGDSRGVHEPNLT